MDAACLRRGIVLCCFEQPDIVPTYVTTCPSHATILGDQMDARLDEFMPR